MEMHRIGWKGLLAMACLACSVTARADLDLGSLGAFVKPTDDSPVPRGLVLGAVAIGGDARYQAQDRMGYLIPGAVYFGEQFLYLGDRARYYFYKEGQFSSFLYGRYRFGNLDPDDPAELAGMHKRKGEFEAGVGASYITPYALFTTRLTSDVTGTSKGQEGMLWADFPLIKGRLLVMPGVGLFWRSGKMADYYFGGVSADEVAPGRPQYAVGSAVSFGASLITSYRFDRHWLATLSASYEHYDRSIAKSPIVGHDGELFVLAGVGYIW